MATQWFRIPGGLPKEEYQALRWAQDELDSLQARAGQEGPENATTQREVVCLGVRLVAMLLEGKLDLPQIKQDGQPATGLAMLKAFRSRKRK